MQKYGKIQVTLTFEPQFLSQCDPQGECWEHFAHSTMKFMQLRDDEDRHNGVLLPPHTGSTCPQ
jgi:hypothetical protein